MRVLSVVFFVLSFSLHSYAQWSYSLENSHHFLNVRVVGDKMAFSLEYRGAETRPVHVFALEDTSPLVRITLYPSDNTGIYWVVGLEFSNEELRRAFLMQYFHEILMPIFSVQNEGQAISNLYPVLQGRLPAFFQRMHGIAALEQRQVI